MLGDILLKSLNDNLLSGNLVTNSIDVLGVVPNKSIDFLVLALQ